MAKVARVVSNVAIESQKVSWPRFNVKPTQPGECFAAAQQAIELLGPRHIAGVGFGAHRLVLDDLLPGIEDWGDVSVYPIELTAFGAVLDQPHPAFSLSQPLPHVGECRLGHVGVTHQIVGHPFHLGSTIPGHITEVLVGVGNMAGGIRGRDQCDVVGEVYLPLLMVCGHVSFLKKPTN